MCGIAGIVGPGDAQTLRAMTDAIAHRGPDGAGHWSDPDQSVHLGHRRLAIVDLDGGAQPMRTADGALTVSYNGEIYNHAALRAELETRGHVFVTDHSDTEVLLHGWRAWGLDLLPRLNGMFAFALHDAGRGEVILARDRFGEKPLYWGEAGRALLFGSEMAALTAHPRLDRAPCPAGVAKFFGYGFIPAPFTHLAAVKKLPAGGWMRIATDTGARRQGRYWQFDLAPEGGSGEAALVDELDHLLAQAARRRLMSDVPLGVFLSGGLDSSLILASLRDAAPDAFTIGFHEPSYDESTFAARAAAHCGARHHLRRHTLADARATLEPVLSALSEPLGDASILPTWQLAGFARERVTVALAGDGGDELFAGYDPFAALGPARIAGPVLPPPLLRLAGRLPVSDRYMALDFKLRRFALGMARPWPCRLPAWMAPLQPEEVGELMRRPVAADDLWSEAVDLWQSRPDLGHVDRALTYFTRLYLTDDILVKTDRATMLHGLESRAVFLDNDLVDFCARLPARWKMRGGTRKYLLKKVAQRHLPRDLVHRRKKGFGIPVSSWLREVPRDPPLAPVGGADPGWAGAAWAAHRAGRADWRLFLFCWLALQWSGR
ncbi:asparagine synthase (glutamine-hydrolyzing) [Rhodobacteraceae bacterium CCMM004]|nr:asparagine synthase (glutamine-hydrolyzing) [Rhodobacteraceae bacterium CCMM004]